MSRNAKYSLGLLAILVVVAGGALPVGGGGSQESSDGSAAQGAGAPVRAAEVIRPDSHRLDRAPKGAPVLVEFLDFECEGCRAVYPVVEQLRKRYEGRLTYAIRYFPNRGHRNGELSARVAEAAARQGKLEEMYRKLFETQGEWGESQESKRDVFFGYAREVGLDMRRFEADLDSRSVKRRVQKDLDEGLALGVEGTPTLYLDGRQLQLSTVDALQADIDAAIADK